jgi:hypothetical protein
MDRRDERGALLAAPAIVFLPQAPAPELLAELTSHGSDLSEAASALELALSAGEESALWTPLTMHAVAAYVRPFIHSNVRRRLDQMTGFSGSRFGGRACMQRCGRTATPPSRTRNPTSRHHCRSRF